MALSFPSVLVISSTSAHNDLPSQNGSQLSLLTYANIAADRCPLDADIYFIDPACDLNTFKETLNDQQVQCIIVLLSKDALEDNRVLDLARTAIQDTKERHLCHIIHYFWDQDKIYSTLDLNGCTLLPNTKGNSLINLFTRISEFNLSGC